MRFLVKRKITLSFLVLVFFTSCFIVFNKALFKDKIYFPEFKDGKTTYLVDFSLPQLYSSDTVQLTKIIQNNKFSLVNVWASWCLPCREEHPYLVQLKKNSLIKIIGINYKDKKDNALKFLDEFENPYFTILNDKNGTASIEIGAYGVPESLILNKEKKIIKKIIGPIDKKKYNEIKKLLKNES